MDEGYDAHAVVPTLSGAGRYREIWGDAGRYGEIWGDVVPTLSGARSLQLALTLALALTLTLTLALALALALALTLALALNLNLGRRELAAARCILRRGAGARQGRGGGHRGGEG